MSQQPTAMHLLYQRRPKLGQVLYWEWPSVITTGVAAGILVLAATTGGILAILVSATLWGPLMAIGLIEPRGTPLILIIWRRLLFFRRQIKKHTQYRHRPEASTVAELIKAGKLTLPGRMRNVQLSDLNAPGAPGVIHDTAEQTATIVASVTAPPFLSVSDEKQDHLVEDFMAVLRGWTQRPGVKRITQLARTVPGTMTGAELWAQRNRSASHEADAPGLWDSYETAMEIAARVVRAHTTEIALTLNVRALREAIKQNGGGQQGLAAVVQLEADTTKHALTNAGFQVTWLRAENIRGLIRQMLDPVALPELQARAAREGSQKALTRHGEATSPYAAVQPGGEAIMMMSESLKHVETDSGFHRTYWVGQFPAWNVRAGIFEDVIFGDLPAPEGGPIRHTVNIVARPISIGEAMSRIERQKRAWASSDEARHRRGRQTSEADKAEWEELISAERELVGGSGQFDVSAYITITAPDLDGLERAEAALRVQAANAGIEIHVLVAQQAEALLAATVPIGEGLR